MSETSSGLSTAQSLPIALLRARERVMGPIRAMLSDLGVTEQQWRVLRVICEDGPMDPTGIAARACLLMPSLTRILQKLEEKGYISRRRDISDGRRQVIAATPQGTALIAANLDASRQLTQDLRDALGPERYEALLELLAELDGVEL